MKVGQYHENKIVSAYYERILRIMECFIYSYSDHTDIGKLNQTECMEYKIQEI